LRADGWMSTEESYYITSRHDRLIRARSDRTLW